MAHIAQPIAADDFGRWGVLAEGGGESRGHLADGVGGATAHIEFAADVPQGLSCSRA